MENIRLGTVWCEPSKTAGKFVWRMRYKNLSSLNYEKVSVTLTSNSKRAETHAKKILLDKIKKRLQTQKTKFQIEKEKQESILFSEMYDYWFADQAVRVSMKLHSTPKTVTGNRRIFLSNRAIEIIDFFYEDNKRLNENSPRFNEYGYIFPSLTGNPKGWTSLDRAFENFGKRTGLDKKFCVHSLRHSHITILTELGVSQIAIMERVGHRDPKITTSIYTHVTKKMSDVAVEKLNEIDTL